MRSLANLLDQVNLFVGNVARWLAILMVLLQFGIVLLRYVFGYNYIFMNEGVLYLHSALFMLGAGYTLLMNGHVRVDIFYSDLRARAGDRRYLRPSLPARAGAHHPALLFLAFRAEFLGDL